MTLTIEKLDESARIAGVMASFGKPMNQITRDYLLNTGLDYVRVVGCMKWLWFHWLLGGEESVARERVEAFVADEMERLNISPQFHDRPRHNLFLLHCAIFASPTAQLLSLAKQVVDSAGFNGQTPKDSGDLYESAWCGAYKYWILGDFEKATAEVDIAIRAYRPPWLKAASKPLAAPWLKRDWSAFSKAQKKDFDRLWSSGRKNGTVRKETTAEIVVTVGSYPVEQVWCWGHCGMALLAYREGVEVLTDCFWFPPHALKCVPIEE